MPHNCENCGKSFEKKANLEYHLNKKNSCLNDEIPNIMKDSNISTDENISQDEFREYIKKLECFRCDQKFSRKDNLIRHLKKKCKGTKKDIKDDKDIKDIKDNKDIKDIKDNKDIKDDKVKQLEEENRKLKLIIAENSNNMKDTIKKIVEEILITNNSSNTQNITSNSHNNTKINSDNINQQNVFLNNYTGGGMPPLTFEQIEPLLKRGFQTPVELTRAIHFNPNFPEYHNVYLPRINEKQAMVFVDGNWKTINRDEIIDDLYENKKAFVVENLDKYIKKIEEPQQKSLKRWLSRDDDDEAIINTKNDIKNLLFDNRKLVVNHKNKLEKQNKKNPPVHNLENIKKVTKKKQIDKKIILDKESSSDSDSDSDSSKISNYSYIHSSDQENNSNIDLSSKK
jgi:hypothetical protein